MSRKMLHVILVLTLVVTMLAACGGNKGTENEVASTKQPATAEKKEDGKEEEEVVVDQDQYGDTGGITLPIVDKPTKLTWMLVSEHPANDKLIVKEIEKRTGITLDIQSYSSATYQDKLRMTIASGKLPDIFHGVRASELKKMGKSKAVVAINDYLDELPNFKRLYVDENPWVIKSYGDESGNMFAWPIYNMNRDVNHGMMYRKDVFDKHGIKEWTNTEEFYEALKQLKELYPDSYPMASKTKEGIFRDIAYGWGIGSEYYPVYFDEANHQWKFAATSPEHKDLLDFVKKLYDEKLLDPEFVTDTPDSWTSKMTTGKSFITWDWIGRLDLFYNQISSENPDYDLRYGNPVGPTGNIRTLPKIDAGWSITVSNNPNKEVALKLLDYLTSPSGAALVTLGIEGETFHFDEAGKPVYPELTDVPLVDIKVLEDRYGLWLEGMYLAPDRRSVYYNFTEKEQEAQDKMLAGNRFEPLDPVLNFTDDEVNTIAELQASVEKAANEFNANYVLNKNYGEKDWENWLKHAESLGSEQIVLMFNNAQKRYDAAN